MHSPPFDMVIQLEEEAIPSASWTCNDEEEKKVSCSHTTEGSDENKR